MNKLSAALAVALAVAAVPAIAADTDARQLVKLPAMMQQHMLANMRDHLRVINEIQQALAQGHFEEAAELAEKRLGMSSLTSHSAEHMAPLMPKKMQEIGTQMHRSASQFALAAQESAVDGNTQRALGGLAKVTQNCVACHDSFRTK